MSEKQKKVRKYNVGKAIRRTMRTTSLETVGMKLCDLFLAMYNAQDSLF